MPIVHRRWLILNSDGEGRVLKRLGPIRGDERAFRLNITVPYRALGTALHVALPDVAPDQAVVEED